MTIGLFLVKKTTLRCFGHPIRGVRRLGKKILVTVNLFLPFYEKCSYFFKIDLHMKVFLFVI